METKRFDACGVVTCGRTGFSDTFRNLCESVQRFGFPTVWDQGAYWNQSITRAIDRAINDPLMYAIIDDGGVEKFFTPHETEAALYVKANGGTIIKRPAKYVLTFDGDSIWTMDDLVQLYDVAENAKINDKPVDAVFPVQADRFGDKPLVYNWLSPMMKYDYTAPITPYAHGHFGCTFIRRSAIRAMKKPWFWGQPGVLGTWELIEANAGKMDDDTWFWMKFNEAGNVAVQANFVSLGHMQLGVRWQVGKNVSWQRLPDYYASGKPHGARCPVPSEYDKPNYAPPEIIVERSNHPNSVDGSVPQVCGGDSGVATAEPNVARDVAPV